MSYPIPEILRRLAALEAEASGKAVRNPGVEFIDATDPAATYTLRLDKQVSILANNTGGGFTKFVLPDGTDGMVKEVCYGANFANDGTPGLSFQSTNNVGNDLMDLQPRQSVRLVWKTSLGGWCAINACADVTQFWD